MRLFWLLLVGCEPPIPDREVYLAATRASDASQCQDIRNPRLRGECATMIARDVAEDDLRPGLLICETLRGLWRDECFFVLADEAEIPFERARRICAKSGRFQNQCLGHALSREARGFLSDLPVGEEPGAFQRLDAYVAESIPSQQRTPLVRRLMVDRLMQRVTPGAPLSREICGDAPAEICRAVYTEHIRRTDTSAGQPDLAWSRVCPVQNAEQVISSGLPGWTRDVDEVARDTWRRLCGRAARK
ncbi:MAG: hypothetical protein AAFV53_07145 [Myxococcota bacterium]